MALKFTAGVPGSGKSQLATKRIIEELRISQRAIVTNVPLRMFPATFEMVQEELSELRVWDKSLPVLTKAMIEEELEKRRGQSLPEFLHERYGEEFDCQARIRILTTQEMFEFWCYPMKHVELRDRINIGEKQRGVKEMRIDFSPLKSLAEAGKYHGTLFELDEVHEFFNARDWQRTGEDTLYMLSQHRKLRWDINCTTQEPDNVDKQFRSIADEWIYLDNWTNRRWGPFNMPSQIIRRHFKKQPSGNKAKPHLTTTNRIDVDGICRCYDTAAGAGIVGAGADIGVKRKKGIPWQFALVVLFLLVVAGVAAPVLFGMVAGKGMVMGMSKGINKGMAGMTNEPAKVAPRAKEFKDDLASFNTVSRPASYSLPQKQVHQQSSIMGDTRNNQGNVGISGNTVDVMEEAPVYLTSVVQRAGGVYVMLSDGRKYVVGRDEEVQAVYPDAVIISGRIYRRLSLQQTLRLNRAEQRQVVVGRSDVPVPLKVESPSVSSAF